MPTFSAQPPEAWMSLRSMSWKRGRPEASDWLQPQGGQLGAAGPALGPGSILLPSGRLSSSPPLLLEPACLRTVASGARSCLLHFQPCAKVLQRTATLLPSPLRSPGGNLCVSYRPSATVHPPSNCTAMAPMLVHPYAWMP